MMALSDSEGMFVIHLAVLSQYRNVTDKQADRQNCHSIWCVAFMYECRQAVVRGVNIYVSMICRYCIRDYYYWLLDIINNI